MKDEKSRHIAWRLYDLIAPLKVWVIFSIVCMAGYNIFSAAPAYYAKDIVDAIAYGDNPELKQYFLVGLGMIIVFAVKGLFFFGHNYSVGHLVQSLIVKLRQKLFDHLVNLSLTFFFPFQDRRPYFTLYQRFACIPKYASSWSDWSFP